MLSLRDQLAFAVTGKENLDACSAAELEQLVNRHPYFTLGHLLLASKKQQTDIYSNNLSLYFHKTLWAKAWLSGDGSGQVAGEQVAGGREQVAGGREQVAGGREQVADGHENPAFQMTEETAVIEPVIINQVAADNKQETYTEEQPAEESVITETPDEKEVTLPKFNFTPVEPGKNDLIFEPYHTVDYFASQGIKPTEEEKPADNFGVQLKRFTDWLKVMKKLPPKDVSEQAADPQAEQKVEKMAASSLQEKEVLTEAMAEVWEKQGNPAKAAEIYRKLSLFDPSKMAYFAAKIADLKK